MGILNGKVAVVTGAGGGLGRAHAILMAKEGARVVVNDLGGARDGTGSGSAMADGVVSEIKKSGNEAVANYDSVSTPEGAGKIVHSAVQAFGKLDILVNNAGILRDRTFLKMSEEEWDSVIKVHLYGTYYCSKAAAAQMVKQGQGGRIIITSSTSGIFGNFGQSNYGAAKSGVWGMMKTLALEFMKHKITVNAVAPAAVTRMTEDLQRYKEGPGQELRAELVSPTIVYLCSDEANDITGRTFYVRGNTVDMIDVVRVPVADRPSKEPPWNIKDLGALIRKAAAGKPQEQETLKAK